MHKVSSRFLFKGLESKTTLRLGGSKKLVRLRRGSVSKEQRARAPAHPVSEGGAGAGVGQDGERVPLHQAPAGPTQRKGPQHLDFSTCTLASL